MIDDGDDGSSSSASSTAAAAADMEEIRRKESKHIRRTPWEERAKLLQLSSIVSV